MAMAGKEINHYDYLIIGGGIAGASLGYYLAQKGSAAILEMEAQPGYHTTGRSAAFYAETYGGPLFRPLTTASKAFLHNPPAGFSDVPLITPRGVLYIHGADGQQKAEAQIAEMQADLAQVHYLDQKETRDRQPLLQPSFVAGAIEDPECGDLDVAALHQGYLRGFAKAGGKVITDAELFKAEHKGGIWSVQTRAGACLQTRVLVNAAGAWADVIAECAGLIPIGMQPRRRTLVKVTVQGLRAAKAIVPLTVDIDERFYFKPEGDGYLLSPADESPSAPCDAQPEDEDVARAIDWFEQATGMKVAKVESKWAGLRTFSADRDPVIGYDSREANFFWSAGQGGYGIQSADGWARFAAALITGAELDSDLQELGVKSENYTPNRFFS